MADHTPYALGRLRQGFVHFLFGQSAAAIFGFAAFALTAILLPVADYGAYVTLIATVDLAVAISTFGIDWVAVRFIPEFRANGSASHLGKFVIGLFVVRLMSLLICAVACWMALGLFVSYFRLVEWRYAVSGYLLVLVTEGLARFARDHVLNSLLLQATSQLSVVVRSCTIVTVLGYSALTLPALSLEELVMLELIGSIAGLGVASLALVRYLSRSPLNSTQRAGWMPPASSLISSLALHSYISVLIGLLYGSQALMLLASRMLGITGAAVFGFARNLSEQVKRYLPAALFVGLVRPVIIARYSESGDFARLNRHSMLIYKLSIFALAPVLVFFSVFGEAVVGLLSGGKYRDAYWYVIGLLLVLVPFSHRQVLEMVVNTMHRPQLWSRAAMASFVTVPLAISLIVFGLGVWGLIVAAMCGEFIANAVIIGGLRRAGVVYHLDLRNLGRMGISAGLAVAVLFGFRTLELSVVGVAAAASCSVAVFLVFAYLFKPFSLDERETINRLLTRRLFVW